MWFHGPIQRFIPIAIGILGLLVGFGVIGKTRNGRALDGKSALVLKICGAILALGGLVRLLWETIHT